MGVGERYRSKRILPSYTHIRKRQNKNIKEKEDNRFFLETLAAGGENMFFLGGLDNMQYFLLKYT